MLAKAFEAAEQHDWRRARSLALEIQSRDPQNVAARELAAAAQFQLAARPGGRPSPPAARSSASAAASAIPEQRAGDGSKSREVPHTSVLVGLKFLGAVAGVALFAVVKIPRGDPLWSVIVGVTLGAALGYAIAAEALRLTGSIRSELRSETVPDRSAINNETFQLLLLGAVVVVAIVVAVKV